MNAMKISMLILASGFVLVAKPCLSSEMDKFIGKQWQQECKDEKRSLLSCCTEKGRECKEDAKDAAAEKSCLLKFNACKVESFGSERKSMKMLKIPKK